MIHLGTTHTRATPQSHEAEEMIVGDKPGSYCETQFTGTIDIVCPDPISEYWFGGMQYQLTHHLFPTMPRYKYDDPNLLLSFGHENVGLLQRCLP